MKPLVYILTGILMSLWISSLTLGGTIVGAVAVKGLPSPKNVAVYIEKVGENRFKPPKEAAVLDQRDMMFIPHIMPILLGAKVDFPNNDTVRHNVFSASKAKMFDLGAYLPGATKSLVFDKPGVVQLLCNIHAEMSAYILVLKNPYFAVTDKKGMFRIPNRDAMKTAKLEYPELTAGKYILKTWHEKLKSVSKEVIVPEKGDVKVFFDLTRGKPTAPYEEEAKRREGKTR
ncbi:MAG: hypothetical protein ACE5PV_23120 [Candidatus Poribacteria bacterium]